MRRLLIIADDFGLSSGVSEGIAESIRHGLVGATSAMMCVVGVDADLRRWRQDLAGRIGLHLQLTGGVPCSDPALIASLVATDGRFPKKRRDLQAAAIQAGHIEREWRAQLAALQSADIAPSHLDSHHHVHRLAHIFPNFCRLAAEIGAPARALEPDMRRQLQELHVPTADHCHIGWFGGTLTVERLLAQIEQAFEAIGGEGTLELMTHPGLVDDALRARSSYVAERASELAVLTADRLAQGLDAAGIRRIVPADLPATGAIG